MGFDEEVYLALQRGDLARQAADAPIRCGATPTTRSPTAISACSKRRETWRQSSIAQTRSASRPRAQRSASRCPPSLAWPSRAPRNRPVPSSTPASACVRLCVSAPITIIPTVPSSIPEADVRRTALSWGAATLLLGHAEGPRAATGDRTFSSQTNPVDEHSEGQPAASPRTNPIHRTTPPNPDDNDTDSTLVTVGRDVDR